MMIDFKLSLKKNIYLSYIPQETLIAEEVASYLQACGYEVISTPYTEIDNERQLDYVCKKLVDHADVVVTLTSPASMRSQRIWSDVAQARFDNAPVIPLVTHDFSMFDEKVPMKHYINASDDLHHGCERLQKALKRSRAYKTNDLHPQPRLRDFRQLVVAVAIMALTAIAGLFN